MNSALQPGHSQPCDGMLDGVEAFLAAHAPEELERPAWKTLVQLREPESSTSFGGSVAELASGLFQRMAVVMPVMVVVDDLHWADESTRGLFETISRALSGPAAVVIGSYRGNEITRGRPLRPLLGTLERVAQPETLGLLPSDEAEAREVVRAIGRDHGGDQRRSRGRSGGNAFLLEELVASPSGAVPNGVRDVVLARMPPPTGCSSRGTGGGSTDTRLKIRCADRWQDGAAFTM